MRSELKQKMKNTAKIFIPALFVIAALLSTQSVKATDGYWGVGHGAQKKGLAGAGNAWYKNSLIRGNVYILVPVVIEDHITLGCSSN